jgi:hypothetical protein
MHSLTKKLFHINSYIHGFLRHAKPISEIKETPPGDIEEAEASLVSGDASLSPGSCLLTALAVVVSDQALAILSSLKQEIPTATHQICEWHAVEAMCAKFRQFHTNLEI